jgi:hypothetical protein
MDNILTIQIINGEREYLCEDLGSIEGFEFPTTRNVYLDPPNRGGTLYINSYPGRRLLSWQGLIRSNNAENRRLLASACEIRGFLKTIKFTTCDGIPVQTNIEVDSLTMPYRTNRSIYLIEATAPDFRFQGQTLKSFSTGITIQDGGTPIPAAIPAPIPGGSSTSFVLVNSGNVNAQPIFTVRGPGTNFLIQNIDTGELIRLNLTLQANETVLIDTANNTAYKGNQNVFGSITREPAGTWVSLRPGNNRIIFRASSGYTGSTQLTILYRDSYGGV